MTFDCTDSEKFYELNRILGLKEETTTDEVTSNELTPSDNNKSHSGDRLHTFQNKENNQRYKPLINNPNRNAVQSSKRNQIGWRTTATPYINTANTEQIAQTTNFREFNSDRSEPTTVNEYNLPSTTFPPVNIAQFFDLTTRKPFNSPITTIKATFNDNTEYTTDYTSIGSINEFTTNKYDSNTRIIPDLIENTNNKNLDQADEVVESIKQLQKLFPSTGDDSREKRLLVKTDSVKNRQKLFDLLNHH